MNRLSTVTNKCSATSYRTQHWRLRRANIGKLEIPLPLHSAQDWTPARPNRIELQGFADSNCRLNAGSDQRLCHNPQLSLDDKADLRFGVRSRPTLRPSPRRLSSACQRGRRRCYLLVTRLTLPGQLVFMLMLAAFATTIPNGCL